MKSTNPSNMDERTIPMSQIAEDGSTIAMPDADGHTIVMADMTDEGRTIAMSDDVDTLSSLDDLSDEGHTIAISDNIDTLSSLDEGSTIAMPLDDGGTIAISTDEDTLPGADDGSTIAISSDDDEGGTIAMPLEADDGGTVVMPADDGTIAMSQLATQPSARPPAATTKPANTAGLTKSASQQNTEILSGRTKSNPSRLLEPGHVLEKRYELKQILGKGGFGAAYLAEDIRLRRLCVVKQMLVPGGRTIKQIEQLRMAFEQEANLLAQLNQPGHPNIPEIYDYFSEDSGNYLVMKYIEGQDLSQAMKAAPSGLPWRETIRYMIAVSDALGYMHSQGNQPVLHRDVKPSNILLGNDGRLWLVDFGLAAEGAGKSGSDGSGSPGYTPLEQWMGKAVAASDIYALGATLHHLITSINPLNAYGGRISLPKLTELHGKLTSLDEIKTLDKTIPKQLNGIIRAAVAPDPANRPTAKQLKQQLEILISGANMATLFTFKNGVAALTVDQLVDLCEQNQAEARGYLYNGDFERWFMLINRNDLAEAARQAVKQYPQKQHSGLERFLKLARPGLFWRRLRRAGMAMGRWMATFLVALALVLVLAVIGGAYGSRFLFRWGIATYPWSFYTLKTEEPNVFTEAYLTENWSLLVNTLLNEPQVDVAAPDQVNLQGQLAGYQITVPLKVQLENKKPLIEFRDTGQWLEYFVTVNIVQGINEGVTDTFDNAPVDMTDLKVNAEDITFSVAKNSRFLELAPTPGPPPTATPLPTPTATPTPDGPALIVVYNDLGHDIVLQIETETWNIPANGTQLIEKLPGVYNYNVHYRATGQLATRGVKEWQVKAYRWRIQVAEPNVTPVSEGN